MIMHAALMLRLEDVVNKVGKIISLGPVARVDHLTSSFMQWLGK